MQKLVFTNGNGQSIDLTDHTSYGITNWEGLSGAGLNLQTQQVPFQDGGVFLDALIEQREISVTVAIQDKNDLSARYEKKRQLISALNPKLGEGVLVYTNDYISRQIRAVPQLPIFENKNSNDSGTLKADVTFSCCSPYWEDVEETVETITYGTSKTITNNGDIPVQIKIETESVGVQNPMVRNETTGQQITYNGKVLGKLVIDTNYGKKQVLMNDIGLKFAKYGGRISDVCFSNKENKFVAVCAIGQILESIDGIRWELIDTTTDVDILGITYSESLGLFVAVGRSGGIITSQDGKKWFEETSGVVSNLTGIEYSEKLNLFVAFGEETTLTSSDGITWTDRNTIAGKKGVWIEDLSAFVAVGTGGSIKTSSDGITWTTQTSNTTANLNDIIYINEYSIIYAVGNGGTILKSTDSIVWTSETISGETRTFNTLCYNTDTQELIIATQQTLYKTNDFATWTSQTIQTYSPLSKLLYNPATNEIIGVGSYGLLIYSKTGADWQYIGKGEDITIENVVFAENKGFFIAVGHNNETGYVYKSNDGQNWERYNAPVMVGLCYSESLGLFVGAEKYNTVYTSEDGENWTTISVSQGFNTNLTEMIWIEEWNLFMGIGWSTGSRSVTIIKSSDGIEWQQAIQTNVLSNNSGMNFWGLAYSDKINKVVAVGKNATSTNYDHYVYLYDGTSWQEVDFSTTGIYLSEITYSKMLNLFVGAGSQGKILIGKDGINWQVIQIPEETKNFQNVCFSETLGLFVIVSNSSKYVYASTDGKNWFTIGGVRASYQGICYSESLDLFVATAGAENIAYTTEMNTENVIQNITSDSDIGMKLEIGNNIIRLNKKSGTFVATVTYRQKYIGV